MQMINIPEKNKMKNNELNMYVCTELYIIWKKNHYRIYLKWERW